MKKNLVNAISVAILALIAAVYVIIRFFGHSKSEESVSFFAMDTYMTVSAYGDGAGETLLAVRDEIERLDSLLNTENPESAVYTLNSRGSIPADDVLTDLVKKSSEYSSLTHGAFNILVFPIVKEWGFISKEYRVPSSERLKELCESVASSTVDLGETSGIITLSSEAQIDFGAIAKGYATERAVRFFTDRGIRNALINLGGNVYALGRKPDGTPWKVAVKKPDSDNRYLGVLKVTDKAVITSGSYERFFEKNGKHYHHIIDPETGYPADKGLTSVTVVCNDPTLADALSTALFVMGKDGAAAFWKENSSLFDYIAFTTDNTLLVTEGITGIFTPDSSLKLSTYTITK